MLAQLVTADDATFGNVDAGFIGNTGTAFTGASINLSGNVSASTVLAQLVTADDATFGNVAAGFIGNTGTQFTGESINLSGNALVGLFQASAINSTPIGNATPSTAVFTYAIAGNIQSGFIGNTGTQFTGESLNVSGNVLANSITATSLNLTTLSVSGNLIAGLSQFAAINSTPIGNATPSTGTFTVLAANNSLWANANIATTTQGTGAIVVPNGGISVAGAANIAGEITTAGAAQFNNTITVGGTSSFTNTTNATDASGSTGALRIAGGASIAKDLWVGGNLYASNIFGVVHQVITVQDPLVYFDAANTYPYNYDIGFYSNFVGPNPIDNTGNVYQHSGIVRDNSDNTWKFFSNVRSEPAGTAISIDSDTIFDPIRAGNLTLTYTGTAISAVGFINTTANVSAATVNTGALNVTGTTTLVAINSTGFINTTGNVSAAVGNFGSLNSTGFINTSGNVSAAVYTGGAVNVSGNVSASTIEASFLTASTAAVGNISAVTIGNTGATITGTTGAFSGNVIGGLAQFAAINSTPIGNATASTGAFTTLSASAGIWANSSTESTSTSTGSIVSAGGIGLAGNIFQGGAYHDTSTTNALVFNTPITVDAFKSATTLNVGANSGTLTIGNPTLVGTQATQDLYNTVTATLNFARAANITMGHTDGTTALQGNANVRAVTQSTSFTTGALVVAGGVGVASNVNIKGSNYLTLGKDIAGEVVYPENSVQITANANSAARISIQNISTSQLAVSEFIASADNGSNVSNFIFTGITSSTFNSAVRAPIILPNDGYTFTTNNLVLSGGEDVVIAANGASAVGVRVSATNSNVGVQYSTESTTEKTGAFTVVGGVGIGKDLYVGKGATFNTLNDTHEFTVNSSTSGNVAIFANVATTLSESSEFVVIGGGNTVVQPGVTLKVGSITTMMIPVGPTAGRPSTLFGDPAYDVQGMLRYNTTINNIEFFDGTNWQSSGSTFTVISGRQFSGNTVGGFGNVDGTNTTFTLQANTTTASTIVSINGVMQFPTLAYSVSGTTLTFTEPPAPNDVIDARILTTTTTVESIASPTGLNQFIADNSGTQLWTGTSATTLRLDVDTGGNINIYTGSKITYEQTPTQVTNTNLTLLDRFSANSYTTAKYVISMKQDTGNVQAMEALLTQSTVGSTAGTAYVTTYGIVNTGNTMGTLAANVDVSSGWVVNLWLIPNAATAISNVKVMTTYIV